MRLRGPLILLLLVGEGSVAFAQTTPQPTGVLTKEDFLIRIRRRDGDAWSFLSENEAKFFYNRARCHCQEPIQLVVEMSQSGIAKRPLISKGEVSVLLGPNECVATSANLRAKCELLAKPKLAELATQRKEIETTVAQLFTHLGMNTNSRDVCGAETSQKIWLSVDANLDGAPDLAESGAPLLNIDLDGAPPPSPIGLKVRSGNEALVASWEPQSGISDFGGYVVFCARGGEVPVFANSGYKNQYDVCPGKPPAVSNFETDLEGNDIDGFAVPAPDPFVYQDRAYLCAGLLTSQTSARVAILQNYVPYVVGVAAVDVRGNASAISTAVMQHPIATRDFYKGYRDAGGAAEGGCSWARRSGGARALPLVLLGLFVLVRRRRS